MKIEFIPSSEDVEKTVAHPISAKTLIPQWYKDAKPKDLPLDVVDNDQPKGLKSCTPFIDALTSGYIQKTWCDIHIKKQGNELTVECSDSPLILEIRDKLNITLCDRYYKMELAWLMPWIPKTPKGYSVLCTHPHNRLDLPFTTLTGVIDSDDFNHVGFGKFPFYINKDFEGTIPTGTPIIQITPFKRDDWDSVANKYDSELQKKKEYSYFKEYFNVYRNKFWKKKNYR